MTDLVLQDLVKTWPDGTAAVRGVSLSVNRGEFVVLLGPSGCGKTTTLRMIAGLETPTSGRIHLGDRDITRLPPSRRNVGMVFQFYALYPHMTVAANIAFPLLAVGVPRRECEARVRAVASAMGIGKWLDRRPAELAGGDQQKVALARAIVRSPDLFLMDEPLGTVDARERAEAREFIRSEQLRTGVTAVYVTHDQEEAMTLADRIVVMDGGLIRQAAPPAEIWDRPRSLFVAHFVGSPGMNLLRGAVSRDVGPATFRTTEGAVVSTLPGAPPPGPAVLGFRPEFVRPAAGGSLGGRVALVESLGSSCIVHVDTASGRIRIRSTSGARPAIGEPLRMAIDPAGLRLFRDDTGEAFA